MSIQAYEHVPESTRNNPHRDWADLRPSEFQYSPGDHEGILLEAARSRDPDDEDSDRDSDLSTDSYLGRIAEIAFRERILKEYFEPHEWKRASSDWEYDFMLFPETRRIKIEVKTRDKRRNQYENLLVRMKDRELHADVYVQTVIERYDVTIIGQASRSVVEFANEFKKAEYYSKEIDVRNLNPVYIPANRR